MKQSNGSRFWADISVKTEFKGFFLQLENASSTEKIWSLVLKYNLFYSKWEQQKNIEITVWQ